MISRSALARVAWWLPLIALAFALCACARPPTAPPCPDRSAEAARASVGVSSFENPAGSGCPEDHGLP